MAADVPVGLPGVDSVEGGLVGASILTRVQSIFDVLVGPTSLKRGWISRGRPQIISPGHDANLEKVWKSEVD